MCSSAALADTALPLDGDQALAGPVTVDVHDLLSWQIVQALTYVLKNRPKSGAPCLYSLFFTHRRPVSAS